MTRPLSVRQIRALDVVDEGDIRIVLDLDLLAPAASRRQRGSEHAPHVSGRRQDGDLAGRRLLSVACMAQPGQAQARTQTESPITQFSHRATFPFLNEIPVYNHCLPSTEARLRSIKSLTAPTSNISGSNALPEMPGRTLETRNNLLSWSKCGGRLVEAFSPEKFACITRCDAQPCQCAEPKPAMIQSVRARKSLRGYPGPGTLIPNATASPTDSTGHSASAIKLPAVSIEIQDGLKAWMNQEATGTQV